MTRNETIKNLLSINLDELTKHIHVDVTLFFDLNDKFTISKNGEKIFEDKLSNYGLDFESQKRFIMNVAKRILPSGALLLEEDDDKNIEDMVKKTSIKIDYKIYDYFSNCVDELIEYKLEDEKISVSVRVNESTYDVYIYIKEFLYKNLLCVKFVENSLKRYEYVTLCYTLATEEEFNKAVKFVEKLRDVLEF